MEIVTSNLTGLDYSSGCVNFRDVGDSFALVADADLFPVGRLYRGGKIDCISDLATILNLRRGKDPQHLPVVYSHFPASKDLEKYEMANRGVRQWLNEIMGCFATATTQFPVLVHCTLGKDRTGVVVAAILLITGIHRDWIVAEYHLSDGDVKEEWIEMAIDGMQNVDKYFNRVDLDRVRKNLSI